MAVQHRGRRVDRAAGARTPAAFVDGPVMGTRKPAEQGALTVLASGRRARAAARRSSSRSRRRSIDLGDEVGAGTRMKLVGNAWVLALVEGLAETIALAEGLGVDPREVPRHDRRRADVRAVRAAEGQAMIERAFEPSFPLALAAKDAGLMVDAARAAGSTSRCPR